MGSSVEAGVTTSDGRGRLEAVSGGSVSVCEDDRQRTAAAAAVDRRQTTVGLRDATHAIDLTMHAACSPTAVWTALSLFLSLSLSLYLSIVTS